MARGRKKAETFNYVDANDTKHSVSPVLFSVADFTPTERDRLAEKAYRQEAMSRFSRSMESTEAVLTQSAEIVKSAWSLMALTMPSATVEEKNGMLTKAFPNLVTTWPSEWVDEVEPVVLVPETE